MDRPCMCEGEEGWSSTYHKLGRKGGWMVTGGGWRGRWKGQRCYGDERSSLCLVAKATSVTLFIQPPLLPHHTPNPISHMTAGRALHTLHTQTPAPTQSVCTHTHTSLCFMSSCLVKLRYCEWRWKLNTMMCMRCAVLIHHLHQVARHVPSQSAIWWISSVQWDEFLGNFETY